VSGACVRAPLSESEPARIRVPHESAWLHSDLEVAQVCVCLVAGHCWTRFLVVCVGSSAVALSSWCFVVACCGEREGSDTRGGEPLADPSRH
jgi:hypothetical protein